MTRIHSRVLSAKILPGLRRSSTGAEYAARMAAMARGRSDSCATSASVRNRGRRAGSSASVLTGHSFVIVVVNVRVGHILHGTFRICF